MNSQELFLRACRYETVERPPVWIMRQAGRTLPEYREVREKHSFWEICRTPELAALVTLQPIRRFHMDVAVIFSDILVVPAAMGIDVRFTPNMTLSPAIRSSADLSRLRVPNTEVSLGYVADAIRQVRSEVGEETGVLGFSGAPFTLACYMVEGGSSKYFKVIKGMMHGEPGLFGSLMERITEVVCDYLEMQIQASVTAVQLFDTWAGELGPADFQQFVLPYVQRIVERIGRLGVPVVYYINGIGNLLELAGETGADILGIDWRIDLADVRERLGRDRVVQGNLDPSLLFASEEVIRERVFRMLDQTGGRGHIVNLGHGILPDTPLDGIAAFIRSVADWTESSHEARP